MSLYPLQTTNNIQFIKAASVQNSLFKITF